MVISWYRTEDQNILSALFSFIMFISFSFSISAQSSIKGMVMTEKDALNIRSGPSPSYPAVGSAEKGNILEISGNINLWYYVSLGSNLRGYVYGEHIKLLFDLPDQLKTDLIVHYPLDGDAMDTGENGFKGIVGGMRPALDRYGNIKQAVWFDGFKDFIRVPDHEKLRLSNGDFSIALWIYMTKHNESYQSALISKRTAGGGNGWILSVTGEMASVGKGHIYYQVSGGIDPYGFSKSPISLDTWQHVAVTYQKNHSSLFIYINGSLSSKQTGISSPNKDTLTDLYIGKDSYTADNGYFFQGMMDDIRIYGKNLSEYEVNSLFHSF